VTLAADDWETTLGEAELRLALEEQPVRHDVAPGVELLPGDVFVGDGEVAVVTPQRQARMVAELTDSLVRQCSVARDVAEAAARNLVAGWGEYGRVATEED